MISDVLSSNELLVRSMLGFVAAALVSGAALRVRALSLSGAVAATLVGSAAVSAGWDFAAVLFGFFVSGTLVSRYRAQAKQTRTSAIVEKGSARDAFQVFANGSVFAAAAVWMTVAPNATAQFAAIGALAGACADTWATEIGSLSRKDPRSILTWKPVPAGTSGGVTLLGAVAAAGGAISVGLVAALAGMGWTVLPACLLAGLAGAAADSLVGASLQSRRWCSKCNEFTERHVHSCGTDTSPVSGWGWMDNDKVNFFCTLVAALTAALWVL